MTNFFKTVAIAVSLAVVWPLTVTADSYRETPPEFGHYLRVGADINQMRESAEATFDLLDHDDNGRITLDEIDISFENVAPAQQRTLRRRAAAAQTKFMRWDKESDPFDIIDTNHDGILDRDEYAEEEATLRTHGLQLGLDEVDEDKNGSVDLREFTAHLALLEELDEDGDGRLSLREWSKSSDPSIAGDALRSSMQIFGSGGNIVEVYHTGKNGEILDSPEWGGTVETLLIDTLDTTINEIKDAGGEIIKIETSIEATVDEQDD